RFTTVNAGCTPGSSGNTEQPRRPSDAAFGISREPGVQPRVQRTGGPKFGAGDRDSSESAAGRVLPKNRWPFSRAARGVIALVCGSGPLLW
ncbi:hypothetical protein ACS5PN_25955, partial [Roseateles sp. NT4]|uniref:hypothetical protein n=1 Tax=Roseateles sp. NT4 TaxID=3453715 RepID=UPI003EECDE71